MKPVRLSLIKAPVKPIWRLLDGRFGFAQSARVIRSTRALTVCGMMVALSIVLGRMLVIPLSQDLRVSFAYLPIAMSGMLFGPMAAVMCAVLADIIGANLFPSGPFFIGFTLSAALAGLVWGMAFYRLNIRFWHCLVAVMVVNFGVHVCLNSYWVMLLYGRAWTLRAAAALLKNTVQSFADVMLLMLMSLLPARFPKSLRAGIPYPER